MRIGLLVTALLLLPPAWAQQPGPPLSLPEPLPDLSFLPHQPPVRLANGRPSCTQPYDPPTSLSGPCIVNQKNPSCGAPFGTKRTAVVGNVIGFGWEDLFLSSDRDGKTYRLLYRPYGFDAFDAPEPCPQQLLPEQMTTDGSIQWRIEGHPPENDWERMFCAAYPQEGRKVAPGKYLTYEATHPYEPVPHSPSPMPADLRTPSCLFVEQWSAAQLTGQVVLAYAFSPPHFWQEEIFFRSDATGELYRLLYWNHDYDILCAPAPPSEKTLFTQTVADGRQHWTMDVRPPETPDEAEACMHLPTATLQTPGQPDKIDELTEAYIQPANSPHPRPADLHGHPCLYIETWSAAKAGSAPPLRAATMGHGDLNRWNA